MFGFLKRKPADPADTCEDARSLLASGLPDKAIRVLSDLIKEHPDFALAYADRGTVYAMTKRHRPAIADLQRALEMGYVHGSVHTTLATVHMELGDLQSALAHFSRAQELNPDNPLIYFNRAGAYAILGSKDLANADLQRCLSFHPDENFAEAISRRLAQING